MIAALHRSSSPTERTSKIINADYKFLCLKLWSHWTESHQICVRCTEMFADYSAEIRIAIFQPFWNANVTYEDRPKIVGAWLQKLHILTV